METNNTQKGMELTKNKQWVSAFIVAFGGVGVGLCLSWTATALPNIVQTREVMKSGELDPFQKSLIGSLLFCGALFGCPITAYAMNTIGRKASLLQLVPVAVTGWLTMAMATTPGHLYFGRLLTGFYTGGCSVVVPIYVKELASKENRGVLGSLFLIMLCIGKLVSNIVGVLVPASQLSLICALHPIIYLFGLLFVPDSPIVSSQRKPSNFGAVNNFSMTPVTIRDQSSDQSATSTESAKVSRFADIMLPVGTVVFLSLLAQLSGINVVTFFTTEMFHSSLNNSIFSNDFGITNADIAMVLLAAAQVAGGLPASLLVDRCGRKTLLLSSLGVMTASLLVLSGYYFFYSGDNSLQHQTDFYSNSVPLIFLVTYSVSYCWGIGSVLWIIMAEIVPSEMSAIVSSLSNAMYWISAFMVTILYQLYSARIPLYLWFMVFAVTSCGGALFVARFLPETKGLSVNDIQNRYKTRTSPASDKI